MADRKQGTANGVRRLWGLILLPLGLFLALSLFSYDWKDIGLLEAPPNSPPANLIGPVGAWLSFLLFNGVGMGAYLIPFCCLGFGVFLLFTRAERIWPRIVWCAVLLLAVACLFEWRAERWTGLARALNLTDVGGVVSRLLMGGVLIRWLSPVGAGIVGWSLFALAAVLLAGPGNLAWLGLGSWRLARAGVSRIRSFLAEHQDQRRAIERERRQVEKKRRRLERTIRQTAPPDVAPPETPRAAPREKPEPDTPAPPAAPSPKPAAARRAAPPARRPAGDYRLPPVSLLQEIPSAAAGVKMDTATTARVLVDTLAEFGIEVEVTHAVGGPVVTRYELLPAPGVRVEKIASLSNNLALALKATSVRVQAPIPGKGVVGVEIPNTVAKMVYFREMIECEAWQPDRIRVPLVLGKDVGGAPIIADLTDMPHLLIAGATGSGKTVCMNSILAGLLMSRTPEELRLMLIDPKIVEFSAYNELPHLVAPVITDPKKVPLGLRWAINEMENRYRLFARTGVRNIESYNSRTIATQPDLFNGEAAESEDGDRDPQCLPYIIIIIDELADLMLVAQAEIENSVARLAQLSRAVGIHMILSTQRPSVNVITGTIKANFPARIAFQVAQKVDSRTILDTVGADKLLGRGDMLFLPPGTSKLVRAQGVMTGDDEIRDLVAFIKEQAEPVYEIEIADKQGKGTGPAEEEDDELLTQAVEIIRETQRASTSSLQRRLRIGYTRAARIMDILEERGIVGEPRGSEPREILVDLDVGMPNNGEEPEDVEDDDENL